MATLNTDIRYIKGVGEARAKSLAKLGITDLRSLLSYFPRAYDDRRAYKKIADLIPGENACVCAVIAGEPKLSRIRKGLDLIKLRAVDETGALELTYFNQSYLKNTFHTGDAYVFFGRAEGTPSRPQMTNPLFERECAHQITGRIMPIYPLTAGVSQSMLYKAVEQGLAACVDELPDILPEDVRLVYQLCHTRFAYENIHFPTDDEALSAARRRLAFEELFLLALGLKLLYVWFYVLNHSKYRFPFHAVYIGITAGESIGTSPAIIRRIISSSTSIWGHFIPSVVGSSSRKSFPGTLWNSPPFENTSLTTQPSQLCPRFTAASGAITVPNPLPANVMLPPNCPSAAELS